MFGKREKGASRVAGGQQVQRSAGHVGAGGLRAPGVEALGKEEWEPTWDMWGALRGDRLCCRRVGEVNGEHLENGAIKTEVQEEQI